MTRYKRKWYDDFDWLHLTYVTQGMKISKIAARAHVSDETIRQLLLKHGLKKGK
jgi:transposase